jgi:hypothetical protein
MVYNLALNLALLAAYSHSTVVNGDSILAVVRRRERNRKVTAAGI